ncbi:MAG: PIN domain-containing protein [Verrucomicrobiales bacterium]|nr:PIN domain-containing protein [Verrucomicrobiales bacterium]
MTAFADTSFLCSLYRRQVFSPRANAYMAQRDTPLPISSLLLLEFRQSLRLQIRLHGSDKTRGFPRPAAHQMLKDLQSDLRSRVLEVTPVDWSDVHQIAEQLSARHTEENGHRLADILHVATALHLGSSEFLTFDANQKRLAVAEGMDVPI